MTFNLLGKLFGVLQNTTTDVVYNGQTLNIPIGAKVKMIYRNGIVLTEAQDYTFDPTGNIVFVSGETPNTGDLVKLSYWS